MKDIINNILSTVFLVSDSYYMFFLLDFWSTETGEHGAAAPLEGFDDLLDRHDGACSAAENMYYMHHGRQAEVEDVSETASLLRKVRAELEKLDSPKYWDCGTALSRISLLEQEAEKLKEQVHSEAYQPVWKWTYSVSSFTVTIYRNKVVVNFLDWGSRPKARLTVNPSGQSWVTHLRSGVTHGRLLQFLEGLEEAGFPVDRGDLDYMVEDPSTSTWYDMEQASEEVSKKYALPGPYMIYKGKWSGQDWPVFPVSYWGMQPRRKSEHSRSKSSKAKSKGLRAARKLKNIDID